MAWSFRSLASGGLFLSPRNVGGLGGGGLGDGSDCGRRGFGRLEEFTEDGLVLRPFPARDLGAINDRPRANQKTAAVVAKRQARGLDPVSFHAVVEAQRAGKQPGVKVADGFGGRGR